MYANYGEDLAKLGCYAVLVDGKSILTRREDGEQNLRDAWHRTKAMLARHLPLQ